MTKHKSQRTLAILGVSLTGAMVLAGVSAGAAQAKSTVMLHASSTHVRIHSTVRLQAIGGDDVAGVVDRLCIQERSRSTWHTMACHRLKMQMPGTLTLRVRETHTGAHSYRATLAQIAKHPGRPDVSNTVTVHVTR